MPNAVGRGERVSSDFIYGSNNAIGFSLNFIKPLRGRLELPYVRPAAAVFRFLSYLISTPVSDSLRKRT